VCARVLSPVKIAIKVFARKWSIRCLFLIDSMAGSLLMLEDVHETMCIFICVCGRVHVYICEGVFVCVFECVGVYVCTLTEGKRAGRGGSLATAFLWRLRGQNRPSRIRTLTVHPTSTYFFSTHTNTTVESGLALCRCCLLRLPGIFGRGPLYGAPVSLSCTVFDWWYPSTRFGGENSSFVRLGFHDGTWGSDSHRPR